MLSRGDSRRLAQMERRLWQEDPEFCSRMEANQPDPAPRRRPPLSLVLTAVVIWVAALILGVLGWWIAAGAAACCATAVVVVMAYRQVRQRRPVDPVVVIEPVKPEQRRPEHHGPDDHPDQPGSAPPAH
jgi:hypothetical protein